MGQCFTVSINDIKEESPESSIDKKSADYENEESSDDEDEICVTENCDNIRAGEFFTCAECMSKNVQKRNKEKCGKGLDCIYVWIGKEDELP